MVVQLLLLLLLFVVGGWFCAEVFPTEFLDTLVIFEQFLTLIV